MKRPPPPSDEEGLLNLPLGNDSVDAAKDPLVAQDFLPFEEPDQRPLEVETGAAQPAPDRPIGLGERCKAGLLDLGAVGAALALAVLGSWALGVRPEVAQLPAFIVFLISFSFLYTVVPLTFWGRTPGMAVMALVARSSDSTPLTIQQGMRRWLGGLLTVSLLGLPTLLAMTGRSLSDWLSDSRIDRR